MTNIEIEDVLSSIRRLVSEGHRPAPRQHPKAEKQTGKLVLTPALRIVPTQAPATPVAPPDRPTAAYVDGLPPEDTMSHEAAAVVMEAALSARTDDWEPDGSEVSSVGDWTVEWEAVATQDAPADADLTDEMAEALGQNDPTATEAEAPLEEAAFASADDHANPPPPLEYVSPGEDDDTGTRSTTAEPEDDLFASFDNDATAPLVDEEALRDLVRDILREELQGALGERITRNVRKLVRAEINRALAARELD